MFSAFFPVFEVARTPRGQVAVRSRAVEALGRVEQAGAAALELRVGASAAGQQFRVLPVLASGLLRRGELAGGRIPVVPRWSVSSALP